MWLCIMLIGLVASDKVLGTRNSFPKSWSLGSPADPSDEIHFIVALKQKNLEALERKFWAVSDPTSPDYRHFMSIEEITSMVAPEPSAVHRVRQWLVSGGVEPSGIRDLGDALSVRTSVKAAAGLFQTQFHNFHHSLKAQKIIRQLGSFSIPSPLSDLIDLVSGLSEFPVPRFSVRSPNSAVTISPQSLNTIYKVPSTATITGNSSAAAIEWGDNFSPSDLSTFASQFNVNIPPLDPSRIIGANDPTNPGGEATLDVQYLFAESPGVQSWFWIEQQGVWLYGWATHFFSTPQVPYICSISYGWNEEDQCEPGIGDQECAQLGVDSVGYVTRVNTEFQKIGLRGISLLASSGDSGANGRTDPDCSENHLNPSFPAASPYITAVGATQISDASGQANLPNPPPGCNGQNCASGGNEVAVSYDQAQFASGGGFSDVSPRPSYQSAAVTSYLGSGIALPPASYYNATGRGYPDVAALGSGILIYQSGIQVTGGTSASCPIFAGLVAILNDYVLGKTGKPLGFLNPLLYKMWADRPTAFTDVLIGDNVCTESGCGSGCVGFEATKGWDPVTGLGTPVFTEMYAYVQTMFQ